MNVPQIPTRSFEAFLFDMDGTILSSIAAAERVWAAWARRHNVDVETFLPTIHGSRAVETIGRLNLLGIDIKAEIEGLVAAEMADIDGIAPIAGAAAFLAGLPKDRWAIVTSAPRQLAARRLAAAGLPLPPTMVSGEDVSRGKPAPDCFLLAAQKLGLQPEDCLVFEDAPVGIAAAEAAGMAVMVVSALHRHPLKTSHPSFDSYESLNLDTRPDGHMTLSRTDERLRA